jgi:hypothetical protein
MFGLTWGNRTIVYIDISHAPGPLNVSSINNFDWESKGRSCSCLLIPAS